VNPRDVLRRLERFVAEQGARSLRRGPDTEGATPAYLFILDDAVAREMRAVLDAADEDSRYFALQDVTARMRTRAHAIEETTRLGRVQAVNALLDCLPGAPIWDAAATVQLARACETDRPLTTDHDWPDSWAKKPQQWFRETVAKAVKARAGFAAIHAYWI
jgi:hypothetical protein